MHVIRHLADLPAAARDGAVAIGNFDGVHRGHIDIIKRLLERADQVGGPAIVFTFDPHPVRLLRPDQCPPPLTWTERKAELLADLGVDWIVAYPTDEALLALSAAEFFQRIVCDTLAARAVVEGPNFFFGHNRDVVPPVEVDGAIVSSSRVRELLRAGDVEQARKLLAAPYRIRGMVTHGAGRGAKIGFPTANLGAIDTLLPAQGVYAGKAFINGANYPAALNLGPSPTFGDETVRVEVHVIGLEDPLYGQPMEVDFLARLRDIRPFTSVDGLIEQIHRDVAETKRIANQP
jgi:riboflavin kinase / FMN adenylyltransferase